MARAWWVGAGILVMALAPVRPASAQTASGNTTGLALTPAALSAAVAQAASAGAPAAPAAEAPAVDRGGPSPAMRATLWSLYGTTALMQGLDYNSTEKALASGQAEGNVLFRNVAQHKGAFAAMKVGIAAATIWGAHSIAQHHRIVAIITMVAIDGAYGYIVHRNYQLARTPQ